MTKRAQRDLPEHLLLARQRRERRLKVLRAKEQGCKACSICSRSFPATTEHFNHCSANPDKLAYACVGCERTRAEARRISLKIDFTTQELIDSLRADCQNRFESFKSALRTIVQPGGNIKKTRALCFLGVDAPAFKLHIESLLGDGASWDNCSEWRVGLKNDPQQVFSEVELHGACALSNLAIFRIQKRQKKQNA